MPGAGHHLAFVREKQKRKRIKRSAVFGKLVAFTGFMIFLNGKQTEKLSDSKLARMKYLPPMRSFLQQPYPFSDNVSRKLAVCGGIGLFVALFLAIFEPFGFDELPTSLKWQHAFLFALVTFLVSSFFQVLFPKIFPRLFREEGWRSWKEIVYLLITTVFVGAGNYAMMLYLYPQNTELTKFFKAELITLQVGIFPIAFVVFMKQMTLYRRFAAEAKEVTEDIREESTPNEETIVQGSGSTSWR
jgi:hypothetical protein